MRQRPRRKQVADSPEAACAAFLRSRDTSAGRQRAIAHGSGGLARVPCLFVGVDPAAEKTWLRRSTKPSLSRNAALESDRGSNEDGFPGPEQHHCGRSASDPRASSGYIERLMSRAMDYTNAAASEAYRGPHRYARSAGRRGFQIARDASWLWPGGRACPGLEALARYTPTAARSTSSRPLRRFRPAEAGVLLRRRRGPPGSRSCRAPFGSRLSSSPKVSRQPFARQPPNRRGVVDLTRSSGRRSHGQLAPGKRTSRIPTSCDRLRGTRRVHWLCVAAPFPLPSEGFPEAITAWLFVGGFRFLRAWPPCPSPHHTGEM
jgi:hypothetical protein